MSDSRPLPQPFPLGLGEGQRVDERQKVGAGDVRAARELLQLLIGPGNAVLAQENLDGLGEDFRVTIEFTLQDRAVHRELADPFEEGRDGQQVISECDADIALNGGIRKVALQAAHRQLLGEVGEERGGEPQIALRVLEVDGIHLVRHGGRSDFARDHTLPENAAADVEPGIAAEVEENRVDATDNVAELRQIVVRVDLRGMDERDETEGADKLLTEDFPMDIRVCNAMGSVVAHGAAEFALHAKGLQLIELTLQAIRKNGHLFAQSRRGCWLAMREAEHRHALQAPCQRSECPLEQSHLWHDHLSERAMNEQSVREVIHIFAGEREVQERERGFQARNALHPAAEEVLHRFHVVIGRPFDGLNGKSIARGKTFDDPQQCLLLAARETELAHPPLVGQRDEVADLHFRAGAHERFFAEKRTQHLSLLSVASVER